MPSILGITMDDWITEVTYKRPNGKVYTKKIGCLPSMTEEDAKRTAIALRINTMTRIVRGQRAEILEARTRRRYET